MTIGIVEDEYTASRGLKNQLQQIDESIKVVCVLHSVEEAIAWFKEQEHPELLFLDIQLRDGTSFNFLEKIDITSTIIFCTAYEEYAVRAFQYNSVDYLLKPIEKDELQRSIHKYKNQLMARPSYKELQTLFQDMTKDQKIYKRYFLVKSGNNLHHIGTKDIAYFFVDNRYTFLTTKNNNMFMVDMYLDDLEKTLEPKNFFRINRQNIINIDFISKIKIDYGKHSVECLDGKLLDISKHRLRRFKEWLNQ